MPNLLQVPFRWLWQPAVSRPVCMANRGRGNEGLPKGLGHPACLINCSSETPSCLEASIHDCASLSKKDRQGRAAGQLVGTSWPNYRPPHSTSWPMHGRSLGAATTNQLVHSSSAPHFGAHGKRNGDLEAMSPSAWLARRPVRRSSLCVRGGSVYLMLRPVDGPGKRVQAAGPDWMEVTAP